MKINAVIIYTVLMLSIPAALSAWTNHTRLMAPFLESYDNTKLKSQVTAEPLDAFIRAEAPGLEKLLADEEAFLRKNYSQYPAAPEALAFKAEGAGKISAGELLKRFSRALRINPDMKIPLYIYMPGAEKRGGVTVPLKNISVLETVEWIEPGMVFALRPGEKISAAAVLASASDEPDMGFDLGLYEDNGTPFGKEYGFGLQAFGNASYASSSQAPFHMGFYHESSVLTLAAPWIKQCHPEYRVRLFHSLAKFAFETGHEYWGFRFLGWGCHYVQDLSYPYHSRIVPGVGTIKLLWANLLSMLGFQSLSEKYLTRVSDRHAAGENYIHYLMKAGADAGWISKALKLSAEPRAPWGPLSLRSVTAEQSYAFADDLDSAIADNWTYMSGLVKFTDSFTLPENTEAVEEMHGLYSSLLKIFSASTVSYIESALSAETKPQ
jgi:hypothetical protein